MHSSSNQKCLYKHRFSQKFQNMQYMHRMRIFWEQTTRQPGRATAEQDDTLVLSASWRFPGIFILRVFFDFTPNLFITRNEVQLRYVVHNLLWIVHIGLVDLCLQDRSFLVSRCRCEVGQFICFWFFSFSVSWETDRGHACPIRHRSRLF